MVKVKIYLDKDYCKEYDKASTPADCIAFALKCSALIVKTINDENVIKDMKIKKEANGLYSLLLFLEERESYGEK